MSGPAASPFWIHDLSPFAIEVGKGFGIRWYGLAYLAGLAWGWWLAKRWARRGIAPLRDTEVSDFVVALGMGMIVGGRLGYVLLYEPHLLWTFESALPWWGLLAVHKGGMASHGGMAGMAIAIAWWARKHHRSFLALGDVVAATAPIGLLLGRLANFVNGELWGRPAQVPWAVHFPLSAPIDPPHPFRSPDWYAWVATHTVARHPSQLYAAGLEGLLVLAVVWPLQLKHRRPGLTAGAFFALYACARFIDEFWRLPDAGQPGGPALPGREAVPAILGFMSKGQIYSLPLLAAGLFLLWWAWRRGPRPELYQVAANDSKAQ